VSDPEPEGKILPLRFFVRPERRREKKNFPDSMDSAKIFKVA
jgi:hypothetical protein